MSCPSAPQNMQNNNSNNNNNVEDECVVVWKSLTKWIRENGGHVHDALELRFISANDNSPHRGIFASHRPISQGECLLRLSPNLSIDGTKMPASYVYNYETRKVSPWLRCLAAFYQAQQSSRDSDDDDDDDDPFSRRPYLASLPQHYETLWQWSQQQLEEYLAGTTTTTITATASELQAGTTDTDDLQSGCWNVHDSTITRDRYRHQVRPYLQHLKILPAEDENYDLDDELDRFAIVCQTMSTRCFHLLEQNNNAKLTTNPYFLPVIDLLNHSSSSSSSSQRKCCTTLRRGDDASNNKNYFVMYAECDIAAGQEILHSYGETLTAYQFLHTFGFVPREAMERCVCGSQHQRQVGSHDDKDSSSNLTPALLSKQMVLESCWKIIESSDLPQQLAQSMQEQDLPDEVWSVTVDRSRDVSFLPNAILVDCHAPLTDELVTLACIPFLPTNAYQEEAAHCLLDRFVLQDYYLGKLALSALLHAIQEKCNSYTVIRAGQKCKQEKDDQLLLQELLEKEDTGQLDDDDASSRRMMYGLTVRLEEKASLAALRRELIAILASLDDDVTEEEPDSISGNSSGDEPRKKQKL